MPTIVNTSLLALAAREDAGSFQCSTDRASDYYGLGVRLGIYFAWLGGYIANTVLPAEFGSASEANTIFILALLVAMTNDSRTDQLSQIDGLVLMHLCGGTVFGILSLWGYRTRMYYDRGPRAIGRFGGFGTHVRLATSFGVGVFGLWFWLRGVAGHLKPMGPGDGSNPPNPPECEILYTFFFAKVRADGGIRYYYIVVCAACTLYFGIQFLASSLAGWVSLEKLAQLTRFAEWARGNRSQYATGFTHRELTIIYKFLRVANLIWLIFSAVMVECTLNFNHVNGVLGGSHGGDLQLPSQLLPFLIGILSFSKILYLLLKEKLQKPTVVAADEEGHKEDGPDNVQVFEAALSSAGAAERTRSEDLGGKISWPQRYLLAWLPWLALVIHPSRKSRISTLISSSTGLSQLSQPDKV